MPIRHCNLAIAIAIALLATFASRADSPPNILFIFADDHANAAISAYGSVINKTPNIDRLATEGMLFQNCLVTNSICGPSRAVILTGKHSHINGFRHNGNRFESTQPTFARMLQAAGYQTAVIGKWHLGSDPVGFDHWNILIGQGPYYNPPMIENGERREHVGYTTDIITDDALGWLENTRHPDQPFMLMVQHKAPHRNWQPSPQLLSMYDDTVIPEPSTLFDDYATRGTPAHTQDMSIAHTLTAHDLKLDPPGNLTDDQRSVWDAAYAPKNERFRAAALTGDDLVRWKYQRYLKDYLRCIASVDEAVGRMLQYLEDAGLADNTVVIYSSDQGFFLGEHGWFDKRWMYEPSLRTPLLVRWPGVVQRGRTNDRLVSNLDFAETFLDIAGVAVPSDMQGSSLLPLLRGHDPPGWRRSVYYHYYEFPAVHSVRRHYGVRDERYKLIHFYNVGEWELYDLDRDPNELDNRYGNPELATVTTRLKLELERLRSVYRVPEDSDPVNR